MLLICLWACDSGSDETEDDRAPVLTTSVGIELVRISAGTFVMGDVTGFGYPQEHPAHTVTITHDFYIGRYEVTQSQWEAVMGSNPSSFTDCGGRCPVESVSWNDIQEFIARLNDLEKTTRYRLPTEAEWEYAARAGSETMWSFGDDSTSVSDYAWYMANSDESPHPVGQKEPNAWGLYDVHGNVWEWVGDRFGSYEPDEQRDPSGPESGAYRAVRGGAWLNHHWWLRSPMRFQNNPDDPASTLGFRLARSAH